MRIQQLAKTEPLNRRNSEEYKKLLAGYGFETE
jgi:hypothetical protein